MVNALVHEPIANSVCGVTGSAVLDASLAESFTQNHFVILDNPQPDAGSFPDLAQRINHYPKAIKLALERFLGGGGLGAAS